MTGPFTVLINFGPRNPAFDDDYTKYPTYFALHVDKDKTWFSVKLDSKVCTVNLGPAILHLMMNTQSINPTLLSMMTKARPGSLSD
jgi:hypothetical protein